MKSIGYIVAATLVIAGLVFMVIDHLMVQHWIAIHTGTEHAGPDLYYNWWSGFASDIGEYTIAVGLITGVVTAIRHHNCADKNCWRLTTHTMVDPQTNVAIRQCHVHHPHIPDHGLKDHWWQNHLKPDYLDEVRARVIAEAHE
jgi:hypothetical protein